MDICGCSDPITNGKSQNLKDLKVSNAIFTRDLYASGNIHAYQYYGDGGLLSNITSGGFVQPLANLVVSNTVTTTNVIASGNVAIHTASSPGYALTVVDGAKIDNLTVTGNLIPGAIVDHTSSIGSAGQVLTSTGSSLEWAASGGGLVQPLANLVVSNTVTTSEIICNAFTTSTATNWKYISNAASARSTSVGWQGIRQVFGNQSFQRVYVYNNAVLETIFIEPGLPQFGAFVAVGGLHDSIIVVSGVDCFYFYYYDGVWNGPITVSTTGDLGTTGALWMPSMGSGNTVVLGAYGWAGSGGDNTNVGVYSIFDDGSHSFVDAVYNTGGNRNTVAISGDQTTLVVGQQDTSVIYIYLLSNLHVPVFFTIVAPTASTFGVSIDYSGHVVLLTLMEPNQVIMFSDNLSPV